MLDLVRNRRPGACHRLEGRETRIDCSFEGQHLRTAFDGRLIRM